ncbi:Os04g0500000 [Oryza sativa Japonica Group]|uniref:Os04g0500000 protein n=1 Tax=Oryza sativa subsp. japonica TaxID=39947 RepID=A0A0P0WC66_ORYSJ|nr:Os04g0500000 [Oryza sativa Japonica Group]
MNQKQYSIPILPCCSFDRWTELSYTSRRAPLLLATDPTMTLQPQIQQILCLYNCSRHDHLVHAKNKECSCSCQEQRNIPGDERAAAAEVAEVEVVGEAARRRRYGRVCLAPMEVVQLDVAAHRQIWWAPRPPQTADIADHEASAGALALP